MGLPARTARGRALMTASARLLRFVGPAGLVIGLGAIALHVFVPERHTLIFVAAAIGIIPLAGQIGRATEALSDHLGAGIGGFLNATFGNATELIIGALALREGLYSLVKASITGSIIGNVLLVFGLSALVGGMRRDMQRFNRTAASLDTTMLVLSAIGLIVPAVFHRLARGVPDAPELQLDTEIAVVLFVTYLLGLVFMLRTHRRLYGNVPAHGSPGHRHASESVRSSVVRLLVATAGVAVLSELLVGAVQEAAHSLGMTQLFVGVVVVALVGNAAEHYSAVAMALEDRMDTAISIAVGSSTQIALLVAPVLVFLSYAIAPEPMDLLFTNFELVAIGLAVLSIAFIAHDGETNWMEGVQLLAVYVILCLGFYFLPV
jgi:Ca2+:H+ antiporter